MWFSAFALSGSSALNSYPSSYIARVLTLILSKREQTEVFACHLKLLWTYKRFFGLVYIVYKFFFYFIFFSLSSFN
jgi:hypothetical protein